MEALFVPWDHKAEVRGLQWSWYCPWAMCWLPTPLNHKGGHPSTLTPYQSFHVLPSANLFLSLTNPNQFFQVPPSAKDAFNVIETIHSDYFAGVPAHKDCVVGSGGKSVG